MVLPILFDNLADFLEQWGIGAGRQSEFFCRRGSSGRLQPLAKKVAPWQSQGLTIMMGIFAILARVFCSRDKSSAKRGRAMRHAVGVRELVPRRLEPRRVLDASAPGLLLAGLDGSSDFVQVGDLLDSPPTASSGSDTASTQTDAQNMALAVNRPPSDVAVIPFGPVAEDDQAFFLVAFRDPDHCDTHTIEIDWGDGSPASMVTPNIGNRLALVKHQFLDDNPTGTPGDSNAVQATVKDNFGATATGSASIFVSNVAPSNLQIAPLGTIDENSIATLQLTFDDPGTLDTHTVEVDWGDGFQTVGPATGNTFSADHVYADDGQYTVQVRVEDDDGGVGLNSTEITVRNVAPKLTVVGTQTFDEGEAFYITDLATFTDPGFNNPLNRFDPANGGETMESFTYIIDWGDGSLVNFGAATIDQLGSPGVETAGSFDGFHLYADNGIYTVQVALLDDDGGVARESFQVIVGNVDPTLAGTMPVPMVLEGQSFTLSSLGVRIEDPGFDNPRNPLQPGGSQETFTVGTIDWGDGTTPDVLAIGSRTNGGHYVPTTAELLHTPHTYADNGSYTVTVQIADDDGGMVARSFTIKVENVAPALSLTGDPQIVDEGSLLTIANLGTLTDPGFDNPLAFPATMETFSYSIDWGDGTVETGQLPVSIVPGSPGAPTTGSLAASHTYTDNNTDLLGNIIDYTVTVTLTDDDGGTTVETIGVTVNNVAPTLSTLAGTDIDRFGETILTGDFFDPGADTFILEIDWRDGVVEQVPLGGPTPRGFTVSHTYSGPPNPLHPAADIEIKVRLLDDDAGLDTGQVSVSNPGEGPHPVRIDTTPQVPRLVFPRRIAVEQFTQGESNNVEVVQGSRLRTSVGDIEAIGDRYYELRVIKPDGTMSEGHRLKPDVLGDLPGLFRTLPDSRYALYLVRTETNTHRLVLVFDIRSGKAVDLGDQSEGARDRPPTDDQAEPTGQPGQLEPLEQQLPDDKAASGEDSEMSAALGGVLLASVGRPPARRGSAEKWSAEVDHAVAAADSVRWRRLRRLARQRRKIS